MKKIIIAATAVSLSACAPKIYQASPAGGMIGLTGVTGEKSKAAKIATQECAKFGKDARISRMDILSDTASYECVSR